jgi:hypothetical protein
MQVGLIRCYKVSFVSRAAEVMQAEDRRHGHRPAKMHVYPCLACGGWRVGRARWRTR